MAVDNSRKMMFCKHAPSEEKFHVEMHIVNPRMKTQSNTDQHIDLFERFMETFQSDITKQYCSIFMTVFDQYMEGLTKFFGGENPSDLYKA